jgi:hypothetical protein
MWFKNCADRYSLAFLCSWWNTMVIHMNEIQVGLVTNLVTNLVSSLISALVLKRKMDDFPN